MTWKTTFASKIETIEEAAKAVKSGDNVWIAPANCAPKTLVDAITANYQTLENVDMHSALIMYPFKYFNPEFKGHLNAHTFFMAGYERMFLGKGNLDVASIQVSQIRNYIKDVAKPNISLIAVSSPDEYGNVCFGPFGVLANSYVAAGCETVVVQINKNIPFIHGTSNTMNLKDADIICEAEEVMVELPNPPISEVDEKIASYIVPMVADGSTVQIGIGGTSNAVAYGLGNKKDLGIHTEMLTDSIVYLTKKGVINGSKKNFKPNKIVCTFAGGNQELYEFVNNNEQIQIEPCDVVNSPIEIAKNDNMVSINNGLMVDLTGQVGSEAIGLRQFSGTGGQLDFVIGATLSKGGQSFITIPSTATTKKGVESRILLTMPGGTAVTTPRSYVQYIVTEYGIANLRNKCLSDRAKELIKIAHPDFREELARQAIEAGLFS